MDNSGYTSISVDGITYGLRFGIPAVRMFLQKVANDEVLISGDTINEVGIAQLVYCGYINNCMVKDEPEVKTLGFFLEWVENAWIDEDIRKQLEHVSAVYGASKYTNKVNENVKKSLDDVKKKMNP